MNSFWETSEVGLLTCNHLVEDTHTRPTRSPHTLTRHARPTCSPYMLAPHAHHGCLSCQVGPEGAGHFVKMVHNGIEYGDMQLICEAYHLMKSALGMSHSDMSQVCPSSGLSDSS